METSSLFTDMWSILLLPEVQVPIENQRPSPSHWEDTWHAASH